MVKHPENGRAPVPVAELITNDTVLSLCYFTETFHCAEGLLFGFNSMVPIGNKESTYH